MESVHEIKPVIRAHAEDAERERRLPDAVLAVERIGHKLTDEPIVETRTSFMN